MADEMLCPQCIVSRGVCVRLLLTHSVPAAHTEKVALTACLLPEVTGFLLVVPNCLVHLKDNFETLQIPHFPSKLDSLI